MSKKMSIPISNSMICPTQFQYYCTWVLNNFCQFVHSLPHAESLGTDINQMQDPPNNVRAAGHQIQLKIQYYNWVFKTKFNANLTMAQFHL